MARSGSIFMGYEYNKHIGAEGQIDRNACWAASISWWTRAMMLNYKRKTSTQSKLISQWLLSSSIH
jgi:hypothetical protein